MTLEELAACRTPREVAEACRVDPQTVRMWITKGIDVHGRRVKLAAVKVGGNWVVPPDAIDAFVAACNPQAPKMPESPSAEKKRFERETEELLIKLRGYGRKGPRK